MNVGLLVTQDREAVLHFFEVGKRIALFLARTSPQQTIDHLVYEISQQINEQDDNLGTLESPTGVSCVNRILFISDVVMHFQACVATSTLHTRAPTFTPETH